MARLMRNEATRPQRHDRLIQETEHDTYRLRSKPRAPTACPECGVVFTGGRWQWTECPPEPHLQLCPACQRIRDAYPAGVVHLTGPFLADHREEIQHLIAHEGQRETAQHPLERVMDAVAADDGMLVTTTGTHLARRLGEAVHHAYQGALAFNYNAGEKRLRVEWQR